MVPKFSNPESLRIGTKVGRLMRADRTGTNWYDTCDGTICGMV